MKKLLLSASLLLCFGTLSQTTIYLEDFSSGASWTINTVTGTEGTNPNQWYISCQEDGQTAGSCGTACSINDNSLHISTSPSAFGDMGAAYFEGLSTTSSRRAESPNISTLGSTSLTLSFDMIGGGTAEDYTTLFYSIDGGSTWTSLAGPLTSLCCGGVACTGGIQGLWQNNSYSLPANCENISNLRIGFEWKNLDNNSGTDPSFAVDDVTITAAAASNSITTGNVSQSNWCYGTTISDALDFTATGTFNAGNVYTAQMSDATGSFAAPTAIGTLNSSASGALTININIPGSMPAGSGYRIRVIASDPATVGSDNGTDLVIYPQTTVTIGTYSDVCVYTPFFTLTGGTPSGGTYSGPGVAAGSFDPAAAGLGTHTILYSYTDANACTYTASQTIFVDACASLNELNSNDFVIYPNPTEGLFTIVSSSTLDEVSVVDVNGRVAKTFNAENNTFNVQDLQNGVYFIQITVNNATVTKRLVIR